MGSYGLGYDASRFLQATGAALDPLAPLLPAASCIPCEIGSSQVARGQTACIACDAGYAVNIREQTQCSACPAGSFTNTSGVACELGRYAPISVNGYAECLACTLSEYSDEMGRGSTCKSCPSGKFSNITALSTCYDCAMGKTSNRDHHAVSIATRASMPIHMNSMRCDVPIHMNSMRCALIHRSIQTSIYQRKHQQRQTAKNKQEISITLKTTATKRCTRDTATSEYVHDKQLSNPNRTKPTHARHTSHTLHTMLTLLSCSSSSSSSSLPLFSLHDGPFQERGEMFGHGEHLHGGDRIHVTTRCSGRGTIQIGSDHDRDVLQKHRDRETQTTTTSSTSNE